MRSLAGCRLLVAELEHQVPWRATSSSLLQRLNPPLTTHGRRENQCLSFAEDGLLGFKGVHGNLVCPVCIDHLVPHNDKLPTVHLSL